MALFSRWWQQKQTLERIGQFAEQQLALEARYEATVHVRALIKGPFYGLMFEVGGPFRLDSHAIRSLRNLLSERLAHQMNIQLKPSRLFVIYHESSSRLLSSPSTLLSTEVERCRRLNEIHTSARQAAMGREGLASMDPSSSIPPVAAAFANTVAASDEADTPAPVPAARVPEPAKLSGRPALLASLTEPDMAGIEVVEFEGDANDFAVSDLFASSELLADAQPARAAG